MFFSHMRVRDAMCKCVYCERGVGGWMGGYGCVHTSNFRCNDVRRASCCFFTSEGMSVSPARLSSLLCVLCVRKRASMCVCVCLCVCVRVCVFVCVCRRKSPLAYLQSSYFVFYFGAELCTLVTCTISCTHIFINVCPYYEQAWV
jgi:hypothetical protein